MLECALNEFYHTFEQFSIVLCADYTRFYNYTHFHRLSLLGRHSFHLYLKKKVDKICRIQNILMYIEIYGNKSFITISTSKQTLNQFMN